MQTSLRNSIPPGFSSPVPPETNGGQPRARRTLFALLLPVLALWAQGCADAGKATPVLSAPVVEVVEVVQDDVPIFSEWIATLDGFVNAEIRPRVAGYVIRQNYVEGSIVMRGQVLFEIDPRPFRAALNLAKAQLAQAEAQLGKASLDVARTTPLAKARAVAQSQADNDIQAERAAVALVDAAKAQVEQAELNLEFTKVTSLISGIAGAATVQLGNLVGPDSVLTSVSQVDPIKSFFTVSEQEFLDFRRRFPTEASIEQQRKRIPLQLILADGSVYEHAGRISFADREVNAATGAIRVVGVFANPNNLLRPGGYGRVRFSVKTHTGALLVPQRAVIEQQGSYQVVVVGSDNKVEVRPVMVAERVGTSWVITEGLKRGERVIVEGLQKVRSGAEVNPQPASKAGEK